MRYKLLTLTTLAGLTWAVNAEALTCAKPGEYEAFKHIVLKTELMVSALSCNLRKEYNSFVKSHDAALDMSSKQMHEFFSRRKGTEARIYAARFLTELANYASKHSLSQSSSHYCDSARRVFSKYHSSRTPIEEEPFVRMMSAQYSVQQCTDYQLANLEKAEAASVK